MAMNTDEIQPTPPQPSPPFHDTNDPMKTGRRRSTTMMISPNLVAALEYDERTRAMTEASPSIGHIPNSNTFSPGVFGGGLPPPPRTRKNSSTGRTKTKSDGDSPSFQGEVPPANSPPQLPPLRHSPSLSRELLEKPSAWNPYINPAPKLDVSHPPPYTVSAPNSPLHSPEEDMSLATITMLHGHSNTFSAPSSAPMIGHLDGTQPSIPRHRRYLSSLVKGKINIGIVKRSEELRRGDGEVGGVVAIEKKNTSEERLREVEENRRESFLGRSNRVIPSSWRTDRTETRSPPSFPYSGNASATVASNVTRSLGVVRRVVKGGDGDGRRVTDANTSEQPTTASQHSHGRERSVSSAGSTQSSSRSPADSPGSSQPTGLVKQNPGLRTSHSSSQGVGKTIGETSPTNIRRPDNSAPAGSVGFSPSSESGQDHDSNDSLLSLPSPPSPYISISSTRYPSSSALSHSIDIFSDDPPGRSSMSPDRESFIDLASPTFPSPHPQHYSFDTEHVSLISSHTTTSRHSLDSPPYVSASRPESLKLPSSSSKPPLPTTPKPNFKARASGQFSLQRSPPPIDGISKADSPKSRSSHARNPAEALPPTTNLLNAQERAERVRKTRKLTQLFGQNPGPHAFSQNAFEGGQLSTSPLLAPPNPFTSTLAAKRNLKHQRGAASMSIAEDPTTNLGSPTRAVWPPSEGTLFLNIGGRRHSSPLSPQEFSNFNEDILPSRNDAPHSGNKPRTSSDLADAASVQSAFHRDDWGGRGHARGSKEADPSSPMSFMDLSDEEVVNDGASSIITVETPKPTKRGGIPFSPIDHSFLGIVSSEDKAEEERRRKREKLAKLHRFLGSRVPLDLVLAQIDISSAQRTSVAFPASPIEMPSKNDPESRKAFMRRRRSSSAAEFSASWSDEIDRLKEDLNEREKAINVRRAVKMEKMFGVAPPQTLYHTRPTTLLSSSGSGLSGVAQAAPSPRRIPTPPLSPIIFATRNPNKTSYSKGKLKKRPGTADSSEPLIPNDESNSYPFGHVLSDVYLHYRHSLNSLNDIIDRDDKESLVDLHDYLHGNTSEPSMQAFALDSPAFIASPTTPATSSTTRSERRRSLPTRTSMTSLCSEFSIAAPTPTENSFQTRRRRAAKLTQFFGVNYRELMVEIIDSIEKGLEEERGKGTLKPDEIQDLLQKLVKLKVKRNSFT